MWSWIIGLGGGLLTTSAIAIIAFLNQRDAVRQIGRLDDDYKGAMKVVSELCEKNATLTDNVRTYEQSTSSLKREIADLNSFQQSQAAKIAAAEQSNRDLLTALETSHASGALPLALRAELDRLRASVSGGETSTTTGDPGGREDGSVHGDASVHSTR